MQTRLLFVRHAESVHAALGIVGGPVGCRGLTDHGREQARRVAHRLAAEARGAAVYSSTLPRAIETAAAIAGELGVAVREDCALCTWHVPGYADGMASAEFRSQHAVGGGGVFRPFERDNETWAELVVRGSRAIVELADRHAGATVVVVGHSETVEVSFHALGLLPLYRSFELRVAAASITEWVTDDPPAQWPPARWTLVRFSDAG